MNADLKCCASVLALLAATAALATPDGASAANANPEEATPTAQQNPPETSGLAEIIVSAQRRSERLQDVPLAVTAIKGDRIVSAGISSTLDIGKIAPSLTVGNSIGFVTPFIRGIGTTSHGPGAESSVAIYVDGVYLASASASIFTLNNIEQVEVLKGPQGTLFGRNATGGVIQLTTKDPKPGLSANAQASYGNYNTVSGQFYVTGGNETIAGDLAAYAGHQGNGFGKNLFNGQDVYKVRQDISIRSKWLIRPGAGTTIRLIGDYTRNEGSQYTSFDNAPGTVAVLQPKGHAGGAYDIDYNVQPDNRLEAGGVTLRIEQELGSVNLASVTAYRQSTFSLALDADISVVPAIDVFLRDREKQFSQEIQLLSAPGSKLKWVVGAYYYFSRGSYDPSQAVLAPFASPFKAGTVLDTQSSQRAISYAAFGQASYEVLPATNLTVGARYTYEKRSFDGRTLATVGGSAFGDLFPPIHAADSASKPTFRVSVDHRFTRNLLAYASFNNGFKSGGFNSGVPTVAPFKPETLSAYEVGLKTDLLDRRVRFNPAVFYYTYNNIQVEQPVAGQVYYYNGPSAKIYGLDADLTFQVSDRLTLNGGFMLLHTKYGLFPNAIINTQLPTGGTFQTQGSATGNQLSFSPKRSGSLAADYRLPVGDGQLLANVTVSYNSGFYNQPDNILRQPAYTLINSSLKWQIGHSGFSASIWGRNLTNQRVAVSLQPSAISSLRLLAPPRTYGVTLGAEF